MYSAAAGAGAGAKGDVGTSPRESQHKVIGSFDRQRLISRLLNALLK